MTGSMASAAMVFDIATSVTAAASRLASRAARAISSRTAVSPVAVVMLSIRSAAGLAEFRNAQILATARSPLLRISARLGNLGGDRGMSDYHGKSQQRQKLRKPVLSIRSRLIVLAL